LERFIDRDAHADEPNDRRRKHQRHEHDGKEVAKDQPPPEAAHVPFWRELGRYLAQMPLLTFEEALERIRSTVSSTGRTEVVSLSDSLGRISVRTIVAADSLPRFDNSAVDGYAIGHEEDAGEGTELRVVAHLAAGGDNVQRLAKGEAARIFTGAPVPPDAYAVVMQEDVSLVGEERIRLSELVTREDNIRLEGTDFAPGDRLVEPGERIGAGQIALLATLGVTRAEVAAKVRVAVLSTGDELVSPEETPVGAQIRDSSQPMIAALASLAGATVVATGRVKDDPRLLEQTLRELATKADVVVVSGGVSVGEHDHLPDVVRESGEVLFHKLAIRPGKPVLCGKVDGAWVVGLPGNPASSFVCFQLFAREVIRGLEGAANPYGKWVPAAYTQAHTGMGRNDFVRVALSCESGKLWARPVREQGSFGLRSVASADGLAMTPADRDLKPGDDVMVLLG
jgi:molybdopterin molybdotransferase